MRVLVLGSESDGFQEALECARCAREAGGEVTLVLVEQVTDSDGAIASGTPASAALSEALELCQGLCLTGGADIGPPISATSAADGRYRSYARRDRFEHDIVQRWMVSGRRIFGICRGAQLLALEGGGRLVEHLDGHMAEGAWEDRFVEHPVVTTETSTVRRVSGPCSLVNSSHHQAIADPGSLKVSASRGSDIEAVEAPQILGVQWHPEMLPISHPGRLAPFRWLVSGI